nr:hypothetical protein [uncultured bacterium]
MRRPFQKRHKRVDRSFGASFHARIIKDDSLKDNYPLFCEGAYLRYPSGNTTNLYNTITGVAEGNEDETDNMTLEKLGELSALVRAKGIVLGINMKQSTTEITDMLAEASLHFTVTHVELGNELYFKTWTEFASSAAYVTKCDAVITAIRAIPAYDDVKIGAVALGKAEDGGTRDDWNSTVAGLDADVDAFIYHLYKREGESVENRISRMTSRLIPSENEIWITEYGSEYDDIEKDYVTFRNYFARNFAIHIPYALVNFNSARFAFIKKENGTITDIGNYWLNN